MEGFKRWVKGVGRLGGISNHYCLLLHLIWSIITLITISHVLGLAIKTAIFPSKTCPTELKLGPRVQGVSLAFF
jgi:hypothetical protein